MTREDVKNLFFKTLIKNYRSKVDSLSLSESVLVKIKDFEDYKKFKRGLMIISNFSIVKPIIVNNIIGYYRTFHGIKKSDLKVFDEDLLMSEFLDEFLPKKVSDKYPYIVIRHNLIHNIINVTLIVVSSLDMSSSTYSEPKKPILTPDELNVFLKTLPEIED